VPDGLEMTDAEAAVFLAEQRIARVATVFADGSPHVVPVGHVLLDGQLAFLTAPETRTANNVRRDPRVSCIVDDGQSYADFRGVEVRGHGHVLEDRDSARKVAELFVARVPEDMREQARKQLLAIADERVVVVVKPDRIVSWDHTKR
jgi:PPOX class probable F420-dependent enzyme